MLDGISNFIVHYMQQVVFLILESILGLLFQNKKRLLEVCLAQLLDWFPDCDTQDVISGQLEEYKKATGDFGLPLAIRQREKLNPGNNILFFKYNIVLYL